jgi:S1-C subfamily serine protease
MNVRSFRLGGIALAAAFGLVVGGVGINRLRGDIATANPPASLKLASPSEGPSRNSFAPIVKQVLPEVVNISTSIESLQAGDEHQGQ